MQHIDNLSRSAALGVAREIRAHAYEKTDNGIFLPRSKLFIGGAFGHQNLDQDAGRSIDGNRFTPEGLTYVLNAAFGGGAQIPAFFIAPFSGNVSPADTWTGANFAANATEFTAYAGTTRPAWTEANAAAAAIGNTASQAVFTFSAGGPYNLYGMALLSSSTKGGTGGILAAATRFAAPRLNQQAGDRLAVEYVITAADEGV